MTHTEELMAQPPSMAEMAGGVLEADRNVVPGMSVDGHDAALAVAVELAAEGHSTPASRAAAPEVVPPGLAALEAETEE